MSEPCALLENADLAPHNTLRVAARARWLAENLERAVLGELAINLQAAAMVSRSPAFVTTTDVLREWREQLSALVSQEAQG